MFERIAQTEADKDAEALIGRSADQIAALRLAAFLLIVNALVTATVVILLKGTIPLVSIAISLGLAFYLYKLRPRAEALALGLTIFAAVIQTLLILVNTIQGNASPGSAFATALIESLPGWATIGALLLLLIGDPSRARRVTALVLYGVFTVGFYALVLIGAFSDATGAAG